MVLIVCFFVLRYVRCMGVMSWQSIIDMEQ